jgi:hypothetical protein
VLRSSLVTPFVLLLQAIWFLAPGLLAGTALVRRGVLSAYFAVPVAALVGCLIGYGAVWAWFADRPLGAVYSWVSLVVALGCLVVLLRRGALRSYEVAMPLALMVLVALLYTAITFSCTTTGYVTELNQACHLSGFTGDDVLPQIFADNLAAGHPRALTWGWQGSDRPPLQSGLVLEQYPLAGYESLAVLLQVVWVPVGWALCRALRAPARVLVAVLVMCTCSGFFLFNSVFAWPKLLAGSLALTGFALLCFERRNRWTGPLAGLGLGAAMLAHAGIVFSLAPIVVLALLRRRWKPLLVAVAVMAPWTAYQKLYDPPGDLLLRLHLGGTARPGSLLGVLVDAYCRPVGAVVHAKLLNFSTYVGYTGAGGIDGVRIAGNGFGADLRATEFLFLVPALGLCAAGLLALLAPAVRRRFSSTVDGGRFTLLLAMAVLGAVAQALILLGPPGGMPTVHQGSYAVVMLFCVCGAAVVGVLPDRWRRSVLAAQVLYFAVVWVLAVWHGHRLHTGYVLLSLICGGGLVGVLAFVRPESVTPPRREPLDEVTVGGTGAEKRCGT